MNYYNYFTEIEETFVRRRGKNLFLSPLDWALIESWQERGIPLHVVLRSIESVFDVFDKQPQRPRTIKSLLYCREEIEAQYAEWSASQTGGHVAPTDDQGQRSNSKESIAEFIAAAVSKLRANKSDNLTEDFSRACSRLDELNATLPEDDLLVEKTLYEIEKFIDRSLLTNCDPSHLKMVKRGVAAQLKEFKADMDVNSYQSTFDLMLLKTLRDEENIPRLSLYYL